MCLKKQYFRNIIDNIDTEQTPIFLIDENNNELKIDKIEFNNNDVKIKLKKKEKN